MGGGRPFCRGHPVAIGTATERRGYAGSHEIVLAKFVGSAESRPTER
jgi:hypothetical protein